MKDLKFEEIETSNDKTIKSLLEFNDLIIKLFTDQERFNEINQATTSKHGKMLIWLLISNVALIIAIAVLLLK